MIRRLILAAALACASSAAIAAGDPHVWLFKDQPETDTVHLYYGEPETDDIDLELFCTRSTGEIRIRIFDATPRTGREMVPGHLSAPGVEMDLSGVGYATDDTENSSVDFAPGPGLRNIFEKSGTLTLSIATRRVSVPIDARFRQSMMSFTARCPVADWS